MKMDLAQLILVSGALQFSVLIASALVPVRLKWSERLKALPKLMRQMYWVYGGYVVLSIIAFSILSIFNAAALADGSRLSRSVCAYIAVFWGIRLALQFVFDVREHLNTWWLKFGYIALTGLFLLFTFVYSWGAAAIYTR